ncbi:hypothetical protein J2Z28_001149 [Paenibacillus xylanexedens]|uniref:Uncharacterized protein n=2 Tax=Paenibacillus xylanexedens TaxID=528191 RepID=A0ABS4RNT4_PAEXY|nr:hypothetical protein [Paenibacillus xylanexedens]
MYTYGQQVWGSVDINRRITITASNNTFTFNVDDSSYTIIIPDGTYTTTRQRHESELVQAISKAGAAQNIPVKFILGGMHYDEKYNVLILEHTDTSNEHVIDQFAGNAIDTLFGQVKFNLPPRD